MRRRSIPYLDGTRWTVGPSPGIAIVRRELLSGLRNIRPYLFLLLLMGTMIGGLILNLNWLDERYSRYKIPVGSHDLRGLFAVFSLGLYFGAALLVPSLTGVSICTEKQQDSYDLLRMTFIRPLSLALAKLLNALGIFGLICVATLPVVGVFFFLVGIDWVQVLQSGLIIFAATLSCAGIGLLCSAVFYRTVPAIITAFLAGAFFHGGFLLFGALCMELFFWGTPFYYAFYDAVDEETALAACPLAALVLIGDGRFPAGSLALGVAFHTTIFLVALWLTLLVLRRPARPMRVQTERPIDDQALLKARRKKFPYYLLDPLRRRPMIPDGRNPLYFKERQTSLVGHGTWGIRIFYGVALISVAISLAYVVSADYSIDGGGAFVAFPMLANTVLVLLITPALVATSVAKEFEWGNMDMLHMTLLPPDQWISGKYRAALYACTIPMGAALVGSLPLLLFSLESPSTWAGLFCGTATMLVCVFYVLCLSLVAAVSCRRSITALLLAYGTSIFFLAVFPSLLVFAGEMRHPNYHTPDQEITALFASPLTAALANAVQAMESYDPKPLFSPYWLSNTLLFAALIVFLRFLAQWRFYGVLDRRAAE